MSCRFDASPVDVTSTIAGLPLFGAGALLLWSCAMTPECSIPPPNQDAMSGHSPPKESGGSSTLLPRLAPPNATPIQDPPSPRSHRALRRLQSAHALGQANNQPSLITQQYKQALQRTLPATKEDPATSFRARSNSDASNMTPPNPGSAGRRPLSVKRPIAADALSLDRLLRDGPPEGDLLGALDSTRLKILDQGIKSDTDGMVG